MTMAKRTFDIVFSLLGLIFLFPLFLVVGILIRLSDGGPALFRQKRVGYRGKIFSILKFRTMRVTPQHTSFLTVGSDARVTPIGRFLRRYKLDEFPQLINVLKGEMSFVGPRPDVPYFVDKYSESQRKVLDFVPGITGPASLRFKNESELLAQSANPEEMYLKEIMPEKIRLDVEYSRSAGLLKDLSLISRTLFEVGQ